MFDLKTIIGVITVVLGIVGYIPYLRDVLKGTTKPHVYTWFVWGSVTLIIFALQISDAAGPGAWVTLVAALLSLSIFVLGMRQGDKDITKSDTLFFIAAIFALGLWLLAEQPVIAMVLLVTVGMLGFIPTIRKSWNKPHSETISTYAINSFRHGLSFFALANYSILTWLFPITWSIANGLFVLFLIIRRYGGKIPPSQNEVGFK
ncbi:MAG: hypothetical protein COV79_02570 [Parcubacteria group bacterium CG11_big_fil_rev_8_21_14_0_20_41_14]|nr:MAG: hypothetical protein COV79_02570 [Parcubacteria group bacterium CG11_big_fil_rev_8_21_14_0_20_41_14]PIR57404.1 MAG: hypothetical protein COU72_01110 [Parcubacteria group bacterium CG10_big_fil_rev_8_21_14_0_10_41_35]